MLDPAALHDLLSLFSMLLFTFFNDFPQLIREGVNSLMKLVFGRFVFSEVRELITEVVEVLDELFKLLLLGIWSMYIL